MIAKIISLLLSKDDDNRNLGAQLAVGQGVAAQILEHYELEIELRINDESSFTRSVKTFTSGVEPKPVSHLVLATWALKHALGKPVYI
jgi:hypothetical protein